MFEKNESVKAYHVRRNTVTFFLWRIIIIIVHLLLNISRNNRKVSCTTQLLQTLYKVLVEILSTKCITSVGTNDLTNFYHLRK